MDVTEIMEAAGKLADRDVDLLCDDEILADLVAIESVRRRLDLASARRLAEAERRQVTDQTCGRRTAPWLAHETNQPSAHCRFRVKVATKLHTHFPIVAQALADDRISWSHVEVLMRLATPRILEQFVAMSARLVDLAELTTFKRWRTEVVGIATRLDTEGGFRPESDVPAALHLEQRFDGGVGISARFGAVQGRAVAQVLEARADALFRRFHRESKDNGLAVPCRAELLALALMELVEGKPSDDPAVPRPCGAPATDLTVLLGPDGFTTLDGHHLTESAALRTRLCDAAISGLEFDKHGVPLRLGRSQRLASSAQRKAVLARDGGCVFPGCDRTVEWCDIHHVRSWKDGGPTDAENLAALCRYHHGVTHRSGWSMRVTPNQRFAWTRPDGPDLYSQRHGHGAGRAGP
jgi:hypothetical protein